MWPQRVQPASEPVGDHSWSVTVSCFPHDVHVAVLSQDVSPTYTNAVKWCSKPLVSVAPHDLQVRNRRQPSPIEST